MKYAPTKITKEYPGGFNLENGDIIHFTGLSKESIIKEYNLYKMGSFTSYFKDTYYEKLLTPNGNNPVRNRADSLLLAFTLLEQMDRSSYTIIESGTIRKDHGELCFGDDGCSTIIFDDLVNHKNGTLLSVDISKENCEYARTKTSERTLIYCEDSVSFFNGYAKDGPTFPDLIYLDSFDCVQSDPLPSQIHHLMELTALMPIIKPGALLVVDDYNAFFDGGATGKGKLVKEFLEKIGANIIHCDYQLAAQF